jgi:hypothetical protein
MSESWRDPVDRSVSAGFEVPWTEWIGWDSRVGRRQPAC